MYPRVQTVLLTITSLISNQSPGLNSLMDQFKAFLEEGQTIPRPRPLLQEVKLSLYLFSPLIIFFTFYTAGDMLSLVAWSCCGGGGFWWLNWELNTRITDFCYGFLDLIYLDYVFAFIYMAFFLGLFMLMQIMFLPKMNLWSYFFWKVISIDSKD